MKTWLFPFLVSSVTGHTALFERNTVRFSIYCNFKLTLIMTPHYCHRIFISHRQSNREATRCWIYIFIVACLLIEALSWKEGNEMISERCWRTEMLEMSSVLVAGSFVLSAAKPRLCILPLGHLRLLTFFSFLTLASSPVFRPQPLSATRASSAHRQPVYLVFLAGPVAASALS